MPVDTSQGAVSVGAREWAALGGTGRVSDTGGCVGGSGEERPRGSDREGGR